MVSQPGIPLPTIKMFSDLPAAVGTHPGCLAFVCPLGIKWDSAMLENTGSEHSSSGKALGPPQGSSLLAGHCLGKQGGWLNLHPGQVWWQPRQTAANHETKALDSKLCCFTLWQLRHWIRGKPMFICSIFFLNGAS